MLDKMWWKIFEETGNVDAYLIYINMKNSNNIKKNDVNSNGQSSVTNFN